MRTQFNGYSVRNSPPGTENLLYERFCKPTPDFFPQCQDHGPDCREVSGLLREHEDAEKPGDRQAETECCAPPQFAHRAGCHLRGVQVRVRVRVLAEIQMCIADCGGNGRGSADFKPSGKDWVGLQELGADGGWDDDVLEKLTQVPQFAEAGSVFMRVSGRRTRFFCTTFARFRRRLPSGGRRGFGCAWAVPGRGGRAVRRRGARGARRFGSSVRFAFRPGVRGWRCPCF